MKAALIRLRSRTIDTSAEAIELADRYLTMGILPARFYADALHVAIAVCGDIDM